MGNDLGVRGSTGGRAALAAALAMAVACRGGVGGGAAAGAGPAQAAGGGALDPARYAAADGPALAATTAAPATCGGTGAHDRHQSEGITCSACHPCGGTFGFQDPVTFPGGTTSAGGTVSTASGTTTCSVGCHSPFGAPPTTVTWSTPGPLACSACHVQIAPADGTYRSAHAIAQTDPTANRAACQSCHDTSQHTSGTIRIDLGNGTTADASVTDPQQQATICTSCHGGSGRTIDGETPPLLVGWSDAVQGDFHGARAGTGFGGTLASGYAVGQGPLACTECHDPHASTNAFLFASSAAGAPVLPGVIERSGVGAEALCANCHLGNRHAGCMTSNCHTSDPVPPGNPCFFCHGHEGIVNFAMPTWDNHPNGSGNYCWHCHSAPGWFPSAPYTTPPALTAGPTLVAVTPTTATVSWTTSEAATSYVEWGVATMGAISGDGSLVTDHEVTLSGLAPLTSYAFRVRSSDALRNVTESAPAAFTTPSATAPTAPSLVAQGDHAIDATTGATSYAATFQWSASASPLGNPVQYRMQLSTSSSFATTVLDTGWISATSAAAVLPLTPYPGQSYAWRVMARDAVTGETSPWSPTDGFAVWTYDPYG